MRIIWILLMLAAMTSCSTVTQTEAPPAAPQATLPKREAAVDRVQSWRINGKIAVQSAKDSGSASVNWVQHQRSYTISLQGPLGSHAMNLTGQPGHVTMKTSDGKSYSANSPEQLLAKQWGFNLPVSNMRYWVRGLQVPGIPAQTHYDKFNRLTSMSQQGWNIQYLSYSNNGGVDLPQKMSITSPALKVKIVIYSWNA